MAAGAARHVRDRQPTHDVVEQFAHVGDAVARSSVCSLIFRFQYTCARTLLAPTVMTVPGSTSRIPSHTAWPGVLMSAKSSQPVADDVDAATDFLVESLLYPALAVGASPWALWLVAVESGR
jgi:hypothetical protein